MQTLSNIVTSNDPLIQEIWGIYMALPEDQNILLYDITLSDGFMCACSHIRLVSLGEYLRILTIELYSPP